MPIYEYQCTKCGLIEEVLQKMNDRPLRKCKKCSGKVEKLISRSSFALKGGGWFDSGYTKSPGARGASTKSASTGKSDAGKSDAGKSDSSKPSGGKNGGTSGSKTGSSQRSGSRA